MRKHDYYKESLQQSIDEHGIKNIDLIVDDLIGAMENYGMYSGEHNIPNPLESEVRRFKDENSKLREKSESRENQWREYFAKKYDVQPHDVIVEGHGEISNIIIRK